MSRPRMTALILAFLAALPLSAAAQTQTVEVPKSACPALDKALPKLWMGWTTPDPLLGGATMAAAGKLVAGHAYRATLTASLQMSYTVPPDKPAGAGTFGGLFVLSIDQAGTYEVALDQGAWVDVAKNGRPLTAVAHGHGPDCSSIQETVDFSLMPGQYAVQLSAAQSSPVVIAVVQKPLGSEIMH